MTNTDDRSLVAAIAGGGTVDDWAGLARSTVAIERIHWNDGASRGNWSGDELERVIERSTVNCVRGVIPGAFAALDDRRAHVSNLESETGVGSSRGHSRHIRCTCSGLRVCA